MEIIHRPVMRDEAIFLLRPRRQGVFVDCTLGGGGHARMLLDLLPPGSRLVALDRDATVIQRARERFAAEVAAGRLVLVQANFARLKEVALQVGIGEVKGILFDLGVSSFQLEEPGRGFSYLHEGPLDMRMDPTLSRTAADLVNHLPAKQLTRIIAEYGEEKWANRIASFIEQRRRIKPIQTTLELVEIIKEAIPAAARRGGPHPAKRTFQALRIAVNDELGALKKGLEEAMALLAPGGRLVVISFHSLEDRTVKEFFSRESKGCICPPDFPVCRCGRKPRLRLLTRKTWLPSPEEIQVNPRSRSAKLRAAERLPQDGN